MTAYSGGSGADIFGQPLDREPVSAEFGGLWPEGPANPATAAGPGQHQEQPSRTKVYDPPTSGGNRPAPKAVPKTPKQKRKKKAAQS